MSERSYGVTHIDELESFPIPNQQGLTWRPIRRRFDIRSFGANAYTAEETGQRVVEEHCEADGHEELYEVVSGRATFTLEGEEHDAPAGTLVLSTRDAAQRLRRRARHRLGNEDAALELLERAAEIDQGPVARGALEDEDLVSLRDHPRFLAVTGQPHAAGSSS